MNNQLKKFHSKNVKITYFRSRMSNEDSNPTASLYFKDLIHRNKVRLDYEIYELHSNIKKEMLSQDSLDLINRFQTFLVLYSGL